MKLRAIRIFKMVFLVGPTVILLVLGVFFATAKLGEYQKGRAFGVAEAAFETAYPDSGLVAIGQIDDAWIFNYTQEGVTYQVVKLGTDWLQVAQP